jgi:hypothetical protein
VIEIGFDSELSYNMIEDEPDDLFQVSLPVGSGGVFNVPRAMGAFRVGFYPSDIVSIEPAVSFSTLSQGDITLTQLGISTSVLLHHTADAQRTRFFGGLGGGWNLFDYSDSDSDNQLSLCGEVGVKIPATDRLGLRLAGGAARFFDARDDVGLGLKPRTALFVTVGLSFMAGAR